MTKTPGALRLTVEEIEQAKTLFALGRSYRAIGRELHRSPHAIKRELTKSPEVIAEVQTIKANLADLYDKRAYECALNATGEKVKSASLQQLAISSGIFIDKARLLRGESTDNLQVQVQVLHDIAGLIRDRDERDSEELSAQWRREHPEQAPRILTATPEPANPVSVPNNARLVHAESRPTSQPQSRQPTPVSRVTYHAAKEIEPDSSKYDVLLHGLPK